MTNQEKNQIKQFRAQGLGYGKIAEILNLSKSTVSSFCKSMDREDTFCLQCSSKLKQTKGHRQKTFCCDKCRMEYWKNHKKEIKRKPDYLVECSHCHNNFLTYKSLNRKYCSRDCFFKNKVKRIGYGQRHDQLS